MADELLNISRRVKDAITSDKTIRIALSTTIAVHKARIFEKGLKTSGGKIGKYSKKYGEFKSKLGRNPGFINFRLTDAMMNDYRVIASATEYGFGFNDDLNANKADWLQDRFGTVFEINDQELELYTNVLFFELERA